MSDNFEEELALRMKTVRTARNMTIEEISKLIGVTPRTYKKYEAGKNGHLTTSMIAKLAIAFSSSPSYLMGWSEDYNEKWG